MHEPKAGPGPRPEPKGLPVVLFEPRAIHYLLAVARHGSIRAAADALRIVPSAVSRKIAELEATLGLQLFERSKHGVTLTPAGRHVAEYGTSILDSKDILLERLRMLRGGTASHIRIACGDGFVSDLVANGLAPFAKANPEIRCQIKITTGPGVITAVERDEVDIGLVYNSSTNAGVTVVTNSRQPLAVISPPNNLLAGAEPISLSETRDLPSCVLSPAFHIGQLLQQVAAANGFQLAPILEAESIEALTHAVRSGLGITYLPRFTVAQDLASRRFIARTLTDLPLRDAKTHLVVRRKRRLPGFIERVIAAMTEDMAAFRDDVA
jgi:DNA-binding transcriptional LysR family regulator